MIARSAPDARGRSRPKFVRRSILHCADAIPAIETGCITFSRTGGGEMRVLLTAGVAAVIVIAAVVVLKPRTARADVLKEGDLAPAITTQMVSGDQITPFSLTDYRGKKVILYFYPKDDTPGCTKEACAFRDGFSQF